MQERSLETASLSCSFLQTPTMVSPGLSLLCWLGGKRGGGTRSRPGNQLGHAPPRISLGEGALAAGMGARPTAILDSGPHALYKLWLQVGMAQGTGCPEEGSGCRSGGAPVSSPPLLLGPAFWESHSTAGLSASQPVPGSRTPSLPRQPCLGCCWDGTAVTLQMRTLGCVKSALLGQTK